MKKSDYSAEVSIDMSKCQYKDMPMLFTSLKVGSNGFKYLDTGNNIISTKTYENGACPKEPIFNGANARCYADRYADLKNAFGYNSASLINHYHAHGKNEKRAFNCECKVCPTAPKFDAANAMCYADRYADLKAAFGYNTASLINHYHTYGKNEKRAFNCQCDAEAPTSAVLTGPLSNDNAICYANRYADLKAAFGYNVAALINHYNVYGRNEGRSFNCDWKDPLATYPSYEVCCGSSNSKWKAEGDRLALKVDTSGCGWTSGTAPMYFTSLSDTTCGAELFTTTPRCAARSIGHEAIYFPKPGAFTVKVASIPGATIPSADKAKEYNWQVNWCGVRR